MSLIVKNLKKSHVLIVLFSVVIFLYYLNVIFDDSINYTGGSENYIFKAYQEDFNATTRRDDQKIRILCWVMTQNNSHESKAKAVKLTWGQRCDILYFVSTLEDTELPAIAYDGIESRDILWGKTKLAFQYAYDKHRNDADWFLKADDDTYVIMENLRHFLQDKNTSEATWYGCHFKLEVQQGYMSGGAGYVLSKVALDRFVNQALTDTTGEICKSDDDSGSEDVEIGKCLQNVNVTVGESRDDSGRLRFFGVTLDDVVVPGPRNDNFWFWAYLNGYSENGANCCSNTTISFHYVSPSQMHVIEFLLYKLNIFKEKLNVTSN